MAETTAVGEKKSPRPRDIVGETAIAACSSAAVHHPNRLPISLTPSRRGCALQARTVGAAPSSLREDAALKEARYRSAQAVPAPYRPKEGDGPALGRVAHPA
jgi:hypothetical protein